MTHLLFVSSNYPSQSKPYSGVFVQNIVREMAKMGIQCTVISPLSFSELRTGKLEEMEYYDNYIEKNPIRVIRPRYLSISNRKIFGFSLFKLTTLNFKRAVAKTVNKFNINPSHVYGHFVYPSGYAAVEIAKIMGIPSIIAVGESGTNIEKTIINGIGLKRAKEQMQGVTKVISVSKRNRNFCIEDLGINSNKIKVLPNGVNFNLFKPYNKSEMRRKLNFPQKKILIAFSGHFNHRKGVKRLIEATKNMDDVELILIGDGEDFINTNNIAFKGKLPNYELPKYLSAADFFVLPTLEEGSCNAILEAMACGLPVISSEGEFNDDIINSNVSIRIDPLNISEIKSAIVKLKNNEELRDELSRNALKHIKNFDIEKRAEKIYNWIVNDS